MRAKSRRSIGHSHQKMEKNTFLAFWPVHKRKHAFSIFLPLAGIYTSGPPFGQSLSRLEHSPEPAQSLSQFCTLSQPLSGNFDSPAALFPRPGRNCSPARCPGVWLVFITVLHKSGSTYRVISPTTFVEKHGNVTKDWPLLFPILFSI